MDSSDNAAQIVIQQRYRGINLMVQQSLIENNQLLIAEIDDDPRGLEGIPEWDFMPLRAVHAVQCSTEAIAEVVRPHNPHVAVFPNQIADLPPWRERDPDDGIAIFYGAQNREPSWAPIMPALNRVLRDHSDVTVRVVHDRLFYDALETTDKTFTPFCEYQRYRQLLATCNIALLPLEEHPFNRCKSDLKFLECAAEGVTVVASNVVYGETVYELRSDGLLARGGLVYEDANSFENHLRWLIEDPEFRRGVAIHGYNCVRDHRLLGQHYRKQYEWYLSLLNRRSELDRSLRERVPELAR